MSTSDVQRPPASDFTERLLDAFFRRWFLYLMPIVVFAAVGVYTASDARGEYTSYSRLSATTNPYVDQPTIRGTDIAFYESPAAGTARLINEQLSTDAFVDDVAERAGLSDALDEKVITRAEIRSRVGAGSTGENTVSVSASWEDPDTALFLVEGTVSGYREYLQSIAVADSAEAAQFWTEQKADATQEVQNAEQALSAYVAQLPQLEPGEDRATEEVLEIQRLNSAIDRALDAERGAQDAIDEAEFVASQAVSSTSRQLFVIDAPLAASAPTSVRRDQLVTVATFMLLGLVTSLAMLIFGTAADRTVRSRSQLLSTSGAPAAVAVPRVKELRRRRRHRGSASVRDLAA